VLANTWQIRQLTLKGTPLLLPPTFKMWSKEAKEAKTTDFNYAQGKIYWVSPRTSTMLRGKYTG